MSEEQKKVEDFSFQVQLVGSESAPHIYADMSFIYHTQTDFSIYFYLVNPPVGRTYRKNEIFPANCKIRVILSPAHMEVFAKGVQENFDKWKKEMEALHEGEAK